MARRSGASRTSAGAGSGPTTSSGAPDQTDVLKPDVPVWYPRRRQLRIQAPPRKHESPAKAGDSSDGARGTRTPDLLGAIQALSQLSYSPERRRDCRTVEQC